LVSWSGTSGVPKRSATRRTTCGGCWRTSSGRTAGSLRPALRVGWVHGLLLRRHPERVDDLAFCFVYAPSDTPLTEIVPVAGARWTIDDTFKLAKGQVGLDHYEVRSDQGWYRHITLALLALAALASGARKKGRRDERDHWHSPHRPARAGHRGLDRVLHRAARAAAGGAA
jgi:SRSO17 transposase